ncbi:MAG: NAD-dependent epimerase/dehydratase family protein [Rhizobiaceae bacterium]
MHILVTGAGGFSGSHIAAALLARGHHVLAAVGRSRERLDALAGSHEGLTVVSGDLAAGLDLPGRLDAIVHAAARSPAPGVTDADMERANVRGTAQVIALARRMGTATVLYLSSLSIYGEISDPEVSERTPIRNPDVYGQTKYRGEELLRAEPMLRSLAIRLPGVLGPHSVRNWLTGVLAKAKAGADIRFYNPDSAFNNAIHVDDLAHLVVRTVERPDWTGHHAITVGAAGMTTVGRAVGILVQTAGSRSRLIKEDSRQRGFTISNETAIRQFGYAPMDIEAMLRRFTAENPG